MPPIRLTDEEAAILVAARPLPAVRQEDDRPRRRASGLLQRQFFDPPNLSRGHAPRWARRDGGPLGR
jgi:hypothetical protein